VQIEHHASQILKEDLGYTVLRSKLKSAKVAEQEIAMIVKRVEIKVNQLRSKRQDNSGSKWMLMLGVLLIVGALFAGIYLLYYQVDTININLIVAFGPTIIGWHLMYKGYNNKKRY
jgi:hypothetical protein